MTISFDIIKNNMNDKKCFYYIFTMKMNVMKMVVVGDEGVGKTSLVCAIISDLTS